MKVSDMDETADLNWKKVIHICIILTLIIETITIICGLVYGGSGEEFADSHSIPGWMRMHHGLYGLILMIASLFMRQKDKAFVWVMGSGSGIFLSDVIHHLICAPLIFGSRRWH